MTISTTRGWCSANDAASNGGTVLDVSAGVRSISRGHDRQDRVVGGRTEREQPLPIAHQGDGSPCYLVGQGVMFRRPDHLDRRPLEAGQPLPQS